MRKKTFFAFSFLTAFILSVNIMSAQTQNPRTNPIREGVEDRVQERVEKREETRIQTEERKVGAEERRRANLEKAWSNYANSMLGRFNLAIEWLERIEERINSRIEKLKGEGVETTEAEAFMTSANEAIESAKKAIASLETAISSALESENPAIEIRNARSLVEEARLAIRKAHAEMVKAVTSLKPGLNKNVDTDDESETE